MLAICNQDIIIQINPEGDIEIGNIPAKKKGVGLERLRFDGVKIVDLADFQEFWIEPIAPDFFVLHVIEALGFQKVIMNYSDRINLTMDTGIIRIKTPAEITAEKETKEKTMLKNRLRQKFKRGVGDPEDLLADAWKLISLIIIFVRTNDPQIASFLDVILPDLREAYPPEKIKDQISKHVADIKNLMQKYYQMKDK